MKKEIYKVTFNGYQGLYDVSKEFTSVQSMADYLKISFQSAWYLANNIKVKKLYGKVSLERLKGNTVYV